MSFSTDHHKAKEVGQMGLFGETVTTSDELLRNLPQSEEVSQREMLNWEKELLGLYVSYHPIDPVMEQLRDHNITTTLELKSDDTPQDKPVRFVGLITSLRRIPTKNQQMMGVATLEDRYGLIDVVLFPRTWTQFSELMEEGAVVVVSGKFDRSRNDPQIICESVKTSIETQQVAPVPPVPSPVYRPIIEDQDETVFGDTSAPEPPSLDELPLDDPFGDLPAPYASEEQPAPPPPRKLTVRFFRNGDENRDRRRLEHLIGLIRQHHGQDQFEIIIFTDHVPTHLMEFPRDTTCIDDDLLKVLRDIPGIDFDL